MKRTFEENNVRFIAAEYGLDTANGIDIMSIFRDVINKFYVADTSRKIKAVFKSRMEKGLPVSEWVIRFEKADDTDIFVDYLPSSFFDDISAMQRTTAMIPGPAAVNMDITSGLSNADTTPTIVEITATTKQIANIFLVFNTFFTSFLHEINLLSFAYSK